MRGKPAKPGALRNNIPPLDMFVYHCTRMLVQLQPGLCSFPVCSPSSSVQTTQQESPFFPYARSHVWPRMGEEDKGWYSPYSTRSTPTLSRCARCAV